MESLRFTVFLVLLSLLCLTGAVPSIRSDRSGAFTVAVSRSKNYTPNGPAEYVRGLSKWGFKVPDGLSKFVSNKGASKVPNTPNIVYK